MSEESNGDTEQSECFMCHYKDIGYRGSAVITSVNACVNCGNLDYYILLTDVLNLGREIGVSVYIDPNGHVEAKVVERHSAIMNLDPSYQPTQDEWHEDTHYVPNLHAQRMHATKKP